MSMLGKWVLIPLNNGKQALGIVARVSKKKYKKCLFGYFFHYDGGYLGIISKLNPNDAVLACRFSDKGIVEKKWQILDVPENCFDSDKWYFPEFVRQDLLTGTLLKITYDENTPMISLREEPITEEIAKTLPRDGFLGDVAVERVLEASYG